MFCFETGVETLFCWSRDISTSLYVEAFRLTSSAGFRRTVSATHWLLVWTYCFPAALHNNSVAICFSLSLFVLGWSAGERAEYQVEQASVIHLAEGLHTTFSTPAP